MSRFESWLGQFLSFLPSTTPATPNLLPGVPCERLSGPRSLFGKLIIRFFARSKGLYPKDRPPMVCSVLACGHSPSEQPLLLGAPLPGLPPVPWHHSPCFPGERGCPLAPRKPNELLGSQRPSQRRSRLPKRQRHSPVTEFMAFSLPLWFHVIFRGQLSPSLAETPSGSCGVKGNISYLCR